jgi:hypothetical protein
VIRGRILFQMCGALERLVRDDHSMGSRQPGVQSLDGRSNEPKIRDARPPDLMAGVSAESD